jgi:citrate lyase beta subunit
MELLHARSSVVVAAKAYGLSAIDMVRPSKVKTPSGCEQGLIIIFARAKVCVDYKDLGILREESEEGRRLGFTAKVSRYASGLR